MIVQSLTSPWRSWIHLEETTRCLEVQPGAAPLRSPLVRIRAAPKHKSCVGISVALQHGEGVAMVGNHGDEVAMAPRRRGWGESWMRERSGRTSAPLWSASRVPLSGFWLEGPRLRIPALHRVKHDPRNTGSSMREGNFVRSGCKRCLFTSLLLKKCG